MKTILRTLSLLPLTLLAVGAVVVPVQAQSMQNGQTMSPDSTANSPDKIGIDASDPYSEQVYSGSQNLDRYDGPQNNQMVNQPNSDPTSMQSRQATCANSAASMQTEPNSTASSTDRIGVDASDPYSEQVYSGSQDIEMASGSDPVPTEQAACENQMPSARTNPGQMNSGQMNSGETDRIGVEASDPYSEQVYSGSQNTDMNNVRTPNDQLSVNASTSDDIRAQQSISQLQQMRYEVLDRRGS